MKRRDFCKGLAVTLARGALAPGAALPQPGRLRRWSAAPCRTTTIPCGTAATAAALTCGTITITATACSTTPPQSTTEKLALATLGMAAAADSSWESDQYYWMTGEVGRAAHIRDAFAKLGFAEVQLFNYTHSLNDAPDTVACAVARKTLVRGGRR